MISILKNGRLTKNCVNNFCEIEGWCPVENDDSTPKLINKYIGLWTAFIKANIHFPNFDVRRSNAMVKIEPGVNLFTMNEIFEKAGTTYDAIFDHGGIILCEISYNCDLDKSIDKCQPEFHFDRIDVRGFSPGFNYRYIDTNEDGSRALTKVYGARVIFSLSGQAGRFSFAKLTIALGAGIGLITLSKAITDFLMEYILPNKDTYTDAKYSTVDNCGESSPNDYKQISET